MDNIYKCYSSRIVLIFGSFKNAEMKIGNQDRISNFSKRKRLELNQNFGFRVLKMFRILGFDPKLRFPFLNFGDNQLNFCLSRKYKGLKIKQTQTILSKR